MPRTRVVFYRDPEGNVPILDWLDELPEKALDKCRVKIERLQELGHELRRPEADYLRDGIYELRVRVGSVNYRMLYFFHESVAAVVSRGVIKEQ
jgi:phage-related protein